MADVDDRKVMTQPEKVDYILDNSCGFFGIKRGDLTINTGSRSKIWFKKRFIVAVLDEYTACIQEEIAVLVGYRDRTNVSTHLKKIKEELSGELYGCEKTKRIYNELLSYLNLPL